MAHNHEDGLLHRPFAEYVLAVECRQCDCLVGEPCILRQPGNGRSQHVTRENRATRWLNRDIQATPWREDREPGACYSTLPGCQ